MSRILQFPAFGTLGYKAALLSGEQGTAQTVELMRQLVDQALTDAQFVRFATDVVRSVPAYDEAGELEAIYNWVSRNIRFTKDPVGKERLYPPTELLKVRAGDCDDISMLLGAMVLAVGYPARLATIAASPSQPNEFSHVYVEVECPPGSGNWIALDAARPDSQFGAEPPAYYRKRVWSLADDSYRDVAGLGSYGAVMGDTQDILQALTPYAGMVSQDVMAAQGLSPYSSFITPYTPGYGVQPAGYAPTSSASLWISQNWPLLLIGGLVWALGRR